MFLYNTGDQSTGSNEVCAQAMPDAPPSVTLNAATNVASDHRTVMVAEHGVELRLLQGVPRRARTGGTAPCLPPRAPITSAEGGRTVASETRGVEVVQPKTLRPEPGPSWAIAAEGSLILTSNKSYGEWGTVFHDPIIVTALWDRLLHCSTTVNVRGESYRLKDRRKAGLLSTPERSEDT